MTTRCPAILPALLIADDPRLAAQVACRLATPGAYLPIIEGPKPSDSDHDIVRRNDAVARAKPRLILLTGLSDASCAAIDGGFTPLLKARLQRIHKLSDLDRVHRQDPPLRQSPPLRWGKDRIGVGLLNALRNRTNIVFSDGPSPSENAPTKSNHVVICEEGDDLSQVVAANYAFALDAGLHIIPGIDDPTSEQILEDFYRLCRERSSQPQALKNLKARLRQRCGQLSMTPSGSATFVTRRLPYGLAFPEFASTHLLTRASIGAAVVNGFAAEQPNTHGVSVAALVDPGNTTAPEIAAAKTLLSSTNLFLRSHEGSGANVRAVAEMIALFPYDLLIIATHCGDVSDHRQTDELKGLPDAEPKLVGDIANGSTILKMYDQDYTLVTKPIADHGTPVFINNACGSWHRFAESVTAAGARAYLGTLFPVTAAEAQEVIVKLLGKHFGQPLPAALRLAQREVYGDGASRPYIMTGVYPQRLRASHHDIPKYIATRMTRALRRWKAALDGLDPRDEQTSKAYRDIIEFYKHELAAIKRRWLSPSDPGRQ